MKKIMMICIALGLTGCATSAVSVDQATQAPQTRVFSYQTPVTDGGVLTVVRDKGFLGGGCYYGLYINKERVASLDTGEKVSLQLPPGEWMVGFKGEGKACISDDYLSEREVTLKAKQHKAVRLFADPSGNLDVKPISI
ncbi:hypothetical protein [Citrobacter youngae]|uniref:hypothetical protein n=1 Tax=Citrobacter youngae TaxID=133448 RepID=UPI00397CF7CB